LAKNISSDLRTEDSGFLSPAFRLFGGEKAEINGAGRPVSKGDGIFSFLLLLLLLTYGWSSIHQQMALCAFILQRFRRFSTMLLIRT